MADRDRLSAIKTEIERRKEINKNFDHSDAYMRGVMACYSEVLAIFEFNEFKEEPVSEDFETALEKKVREAQDWTYIEEEGGECPLNEEFGAYDLEEFARWGANWQKQQNSISAKNLEELISTLSKRYPEVSFAKLSRIVVRVAKWQKQQMIKDAVDGVITFDYYKDDKAYGCVAHDSFCLEERGLRDCDKVKIIVVKEG